MRIGLIGFRGSNRGFEDLRFSSDQSFLDFDIIIWDPSHLGIQEYGITSQNQHNAASHLLKDYSRRELEFQELMAMGRTMIVVLPKTNYVGQYPSFLGTLGLPSFNDGSGRQLEFRGDPIFKEFFEVNRNNFEYRSTLSSAVGSPFLYVKGSSRIAGTCITQNRGHFVLIPGLKPQKDQTLNSAAIDTLVKSAAALSKRLKDLGNRDVSLPDWTQSICVPGEEEVKRTIDSLQEESLQLEKKITQTREVLRYYQELKILLGGKGDSLEKMVIRVLNEIGVAAKAGPPGRDDVIGRFKNQDLVFEIKGKKGSAAESDCMQLEKWRIRFLEENGRLPKGVLLINAFAETEPNQRHQSAFPEQMLRIAIGREHCLMTTSQLLEIYFRIKSEPVLADEILVDLFNTIGIYPNISSQI